MGALPLKPTREQPSVPLIARYDQIKQIGSGVDGEVFEVINRASGARCAMKVINLKRYADRKARKLQAQTIMAEISTLKNLDHPNVIRILDSSYAKNPIFIMDLCEGETLQTGRKKRLNGVSAVRCVLRQIASAVRYIHERRLVHRDLKPDNIMFISADPGNLHLVLIDFGVAKRTGRLKFTQIHGTPYYMSPQVLEKRYGPECDLWSLGVLAYLLLTNELPFDAPSVHLLFKKIARAQVPYLAKHAIWEREPLSREFVQGLLEKDAALRLTAEQAEKARWLQS